MEATKSLWASKTFWGAALVVGAQLLNLLGVPLDATDTAEISHLAVEAASLIGAGVAIWGRVSARATIARR